MWSRQGSTGSLGSTYDIRELVESSVRLMDGKSPLDMELPKPLNMVKNAVLKKIKGTDIEKLLKRAWCFE